MVFLIPPASQIRTTSMVLKAVAVTFGTIPLLFAALFFVAGGPDPGAGSGAPLEFRLIGIPFLLAGIFLALPNRFLINYANILLVIPISSGVLLILALVLIAANGFEYFPSAIPIILFCIGASSSTLSLSYYKKTHPVATRNGRNQNDKWVV